MPDTPQRRSADDLYEEVAATFGGAIERLARGYEPETDKRRDLIQEIHVALWRSFAGFDSRCSLRTWVYRVAHNTATSKVFRRRTPPLVELDAASLEAEMPATHEAALDQQRALERLSALIRQLKAIDRQVILLYLEGEEASFIGEVTGLSPGAVATKVHRIKQLLARQFHQGASRG
jgi:RNA polymerase sigma-70 factor (ECF subfamily)